MQIVIDVDGTICTEEKTYSRSMAKVIKDAVESVNNLYDDGHTIILYSARSWQEYEMTEDWLKRHNFRYHQLVMGKPIGEVWIDDRAVRFTTWSEVNRELRNKKIINK